MTPAANAPDLTERPSAADGLAQHEPPENTVIPSPTGDAEGRLRALVADRMEGVRKSAKRYALATGNYEGEFAAQMEWATLSVSCADLHAALARLETAERENKRLEAERGAWEAATNQACADAGGLTTLIRDIAIPALAMDTFEQVFNQQRFAEDTDTDYFLRCFRALRDRASQAHAKLSRAVNV